MRSRYLLLCSIELVACDDQIDELIIPMRIRVVDYRREVLMQILCVVRIQNGWVAVVQEQRKVEQVPPVCTLEWLRIVKSSVEGEVVSAIDKLVDVPMKDWTKASDRLIDAC